MTLDDGRDDARAEALAVPAQVSAASGIGTVQTEHLIGDVGDALRLLDAVQRVRGHAHPLIAGLQEAVGMKMPAAQVLSAIAGGRDTAEAVAEQVGTTAAEAGLAIRDLVGADLVRTTPELTVTGLGQARLAQLDALTVRVLDVVTGILGPADAAELVRLLNTVADGLESTASTRGAVEPSPASQRTLSP